MRRHRGHGGGYKQTKQGAAGPHSIGRKYLLGQIHEKVGSRPGLKNRGRKV